jgi:cysteine desulfurase
MSSHEQAPVYLDYAATTPLDAHVAAVMKSCMEPGGIFANPSSNHEEGRRASAVVANARQQLADLLNTQPRNLIWTSGATESDNLALLGAARFRADRGRHLISMPIEHKAVTDALDALQREGFEVTWLVPAPDGLLDIEQLREAVRDDTQVVSVMHVKNETGAIQDIEAIGRFCRERGILFHTDAAQSVGKISIDLATLPVDLLSLTAHKFYGPKGVGALYMADRPGCQLQPLMYGGGQERGLRPGTLAVHQIAGLGAAAELAARELENGYLHVAALRERLWAEIRQLPGMHRNGSSQQSYPGILNVSADGVDGESLMLALAPLCVASGSACNSQTGESSYVLRALGRSDHLAQSAIRFSFGRHTTAVEVDFAAEKYSAAVNALRAIAPVRN